ncbi:hypothetical protein LLY23_10695 [Morganella morganii]|uniref:hypothetical protein n=1 Tax=Morganella morganii TaxID=582 RepID=UPI0007DB8BA9|nr:hypothetical protein [Morganella morganii]HDS7362039.1 hypothetical protein [Morganella morganii subsp. morganii]OAS00522.1 hypothetical protein AYO06_07625 [Morganella morganii]UEH02314.1 hypothetical protein LLY23_10695 [Morganella morganii]WNJ21749.1 hypothetical protein RJD34_10235 [Morganella morganii]HEO9694618.1 hypothetical protein [Morganella morganii subsp. morganii]
MKENEDKQVIIDQKVSNYIGNRIKWLKDEKYKNNVINRINAINECMMLISTTDIVSPECYKLLESDFNSEKKSVEKRFSFDSPN